MSRAANLLIDALCFMLCACVFGVGVYAFVMPDPMMVERGEQARQQMLLELREVEARCEAQELRRVRAVREPTADELADARSYCDRTSAWR